MASYVKIKITKQLKLILTFSPSKVEIWLKLASRYSIPYKKKKKEIYCQTEDKYNKLEVNLIIWKPEKI